MLPSVRQIHFDAAVVALRDEAEGKSFKEGIKRGRVRFRPLTSPQPVIPDGVQRSCMASSGNQRLIRAAAASLFGMPDT